MNGSLHERARRLHERAVIRSWEYRQRNHSTGVWYRLRRVLVDAAEAWAISEGAADGLERAGRTPLPVGRELDPPKRLFFVTPDELATISGCRCIPVRLCPELLQARDVALVSHADPGAADGE